jgi:DNA-binding MarR family transcriptional regulator
MGNSTTFCFIDRTLSLFPSMAHTLAGLRFTELALLTLRLNGKLARAADRLVGDLGLTRARWQVLAVIGEGSTTVPRAARQLALTRQSVQLTADRLVADGLVRFAANPDHQKSPLLALTGEGERVMREVRQRQEIWANRVVEGLDTAQLATTCRMLAVLERQLARTSHRVS